VALASKSEPGRPMTLGGVAAAGVRIMQGHQVG
jgi:hypothetical protein